MLFVNINQMDYRQAWELQHSLVYARHNNIVTEDVVLFLQHPSVFTLGKRGGLENLTVSQEFISKKGIEVVQVERGGNITYHGPGQLVVYPILDLKKAELKVVEYVDILEQVMSQTVADWNIFASGDPKNRGLWIGNQKLGSIGITIKRGISYHGIALNVNPSLEPFSWINACGIKNIHVTSMKEQIGQSVSIEEVRKRLQCHLSNALGKQGVDTEIDSIYSKLVL